MTEPAPEDKQQESFSCETTPVEMCLSAAAGRLDQEKQEQSYSGGSNSIVDSYLRGEIPFEQYWNHLQLQSDRDPGSMKSRGSGRVRGRGGGRGAKRRRENEASTSQNLSGFGECNVSSLRDELLSSETQDLLDEYSQDLSIKDDLNEQDSELLAIVSEGATEDTDDPLDQDYSPAGEKRRTGGQKRGRGKRAHRSQKGAKKTTAEDEDSVLGVPEEWRQVELGGSAKTYKELVRPLRRLPETLQALVGQANMYYAQGRKDEALQMMELVLKEKPKNPEAYQCMANLFEDMGDKKKQLQCGLLAAYLDYLTPGVVWAQLGQLAEELDKTDQAIACYGRAYKAEPANWSNYELKLKLLEKNSGENKRILDTKLAAVRGMKDTQDFDWYEKLVKETAEMAFSRKDPMEGINCYRFLLEKGRKNGKTLYQVLEKQVETLMSLNNFTVAAKALFEFSDLEAYHNGDLAVCFEENKQLPFPPLSIDEYMIPVELIPKLEIKMVVCWLELDRYDLAKPLLDIINDNRVLSEDYLEIERVYASKNRVDLAKSLLERMLNTENLKKSPVVWLAYAEVLATIGSVDEACEAFEKVVQLSPEHVEARVNLAALQQQLGQTERALETLDFGVTPERFDIQNVEIKDERLLHKECMILYSQQKWESFLRCAYRILAPYFYDIYAVQVKREAARNLYRDKNGLKRLSLHVRRVTLEVSRDTLLERLVKKIGKGSFLNYVTPFSQDDPKALVSSSASKQKVSKQFSATDLNDLCFKNVLCRKRLALPDKTRFHVLRRRFHVFHVCEVLFDQKRFEELTQVAGFSANIPPLVISGLSRTFEQIMLLGALESKNSKVAFPLLHNSVAHVDRPRLWNLYGLIFVLSQDVSYHRIILRAAAKQPDNLALAILSGNNSLISGTYQHALAEYISVLQQCPGDPLVNLLTGLTCLHLACKKDIARRHDICLQGFAFLSQYEELRGCSQESCYNLGRAMQQANILFAATHYYRKVLDSEPLIATSDIHSSEEDEDAVAVKPRVYDLRPLAAHNLAIIYQNSGNTVMARQLLDTYCCV